MNTHLYFKQNFEDFNADNLYFIKEPELPDEVMWK